MRLKFLKKTVKDVKVTAEKEGKKNILKICKTFFCKILDKSIGTSYNVSSQRKRVLTLD